MSEPTFEPPDKNMFSSSRGTKSFEEDKTMWAILEDSDTQSTGSLVPRGHESSSQPVRIVGPIEEDANNRHVVEVPASAEAIAQGYKPLLPNSETFHDELDDLRSDMAESQGKIGQMSQELDNHSQRIATVEDRIDSTFVEDLKESAAAEAVEAIYKGLIGTGVAIGLIGILLGLIYQSPLLILLSVVGSIFLVYAFRNSPIK